MAELLVGTAGVARWDSSQLSTLAVPVETQAAEIQALDPAQS